MVVVDRENRTILKTERIDGTEIAAILTERARLDDDQGFYNQEREEVIEALSTYVDDSDSDSDDDDVADFMGFLGFVNERNDWTTDPQ